MAEGGQVGVVFVEDVDLADTLNERWAEIKTWFGKADLKKMLFFLANAGKDLFVTAEEVRALRAKGIVIYRDDYSIHRQCEELERKLNKSRLSKGEVRLLKREADRLHIQDSLIDYMFAKHGHTSLFDTALETQLLGSRRDAETFAVPNTEDNLMTPSEARNLGLEFPFSAWRQICDFSVDMRLGGQGYRILAFCEELGRLVPYMSQLDSQLLGFQQNHIVAATFVANKQKMEVRRHFKKPEIKVRTVRLLDWETKMHGWTEPIVDFTAVKYEGADPEVKLDVAAEFLACKEEKVGNLSTGPQEDEMKIVFKLAEMNYGRRLVNAKDDIDNFIGNIPTPEYDIADMADFNE